MFTEILYVEGVIFSTTVLALALNQLGAPQLPAGSSVTLPGSLVKASVPGVPYDLQRNG